MDGAPATPLADAACCTVVHAREPIGDGAMISCEVVGRHAQCGVQGLGCWHTICHMSLRCRAWGHLARLGDVGKGADAALAAFVSRSLAAPDLEKIGACDQGVAYPSERDCN